ncbi:MAG: hypothetical protein GC180_06665 [Bacteroidetes bacterium]|nr:hypothetical protein [Bacteroidota bacterium]
MKRLLILVLAGLGTQVHAQRIDSLSIIKTGFICQFTYNYNIARADLAKRYSNCSAVGAGVYYKTGKNWIFGVEGSYWFGGKLMEKGIFSAIVDSSGNAIDNNGGVVAVNAQERGFNLGMKVGKIIPLGRNKNSGLMLSMGMGYVEHFLRLTNSSVSIAALQGDFRYGYDRWTTGYMINEFIGYQNLDKKKRINFFVGLEFAQGYTHSRRKIDYDKMSGNTTPRRDNYIGLRFGWLLPIYTGTANNQGGYRFK